MKKYYFTYGSNHITTGGLNLGNYYTIIRADNYTAARKVMFDHRNDLWSMQYESAEEAGVDRFSLKEISINDVSLFA